MVRLFVAITNRTWFEMLRASEPHEEVNFWQAYRFDPVPGARTGRALCSS
jgi:hypothetical protein